jgi:ABC-type transport system involved in multi-copper enzyme maturation permease subunit
MADRSVDSSSPQRSGSGRPSVVSRLLSNPVTVKELRSRMRGRRAFAVLTLYLLILGGVISLVYLAYSANTLGPGSGAARTAGKGLFAAVLAVQVFLVVFIGPAFTAGAISGERERQTFDLLRTTLLSAESFVLGKLISALSYVFLLVLVSIPLQSIAFLLGGLSLTELVVSQVVILVAAVAYALYGLWCSAALRTTLAATVTTFAGMLFVAFGTPLLAGMAAVLGSTLSGTWLSGPLIEALVLYGGITAAATNLPATLILSETLYLEQDALFGFTSTIGGTTVWAVSPWLLFILFHALAALALYVWTVRRVRRVSDV